jgi:Uma2 family endonuclease
MTAVITIPSPSSYEPPVVSPDNLAEVVSRLGDISLARIRSKPALGTATEKDVILFGEKHGIRCELVDGILVEKPVGFYESKLAFLLGHLIQTYLGSNPIASVAGIDAPHRTIQNQVRMPDVSVVLNEKLSIETLKEQKILEQPPDLAVEILSESNTKQEMDRKLKEYFEAGTSLVWYIDPQSETAEEFTSPESAHPVSGDQELNGGEILPGFTVKLSELFAQAKAGMPKAK